MFQGNPTSFDPFLRVKPKLIYESNYDWLIQQVRTHSGDACLIWPFATNRKGFGIVKVKGSRDSALVHRIAFQIATGTTPRKCVVQTCNDRLCFAPKHLEERKHARRNPNPTPRAFKLYEWLRRQIALHHSDECLLWPYAGSGPMDYGVVRSPLTPGRYEYVHRIAFFLVNGHWPEPETLHSCDVPRCFSVYHLSEGTRQQNTADKVRKGRAGSPALKGEAHGRSKLRAIDVQGIRSARVAGKSILDIAQRYNISTVHVTRIITRKSWSHLK